VVGKVEEKGEENCRRVTVRDDGGGDGGRVRMLRAEIGGCCGSVVLLLGEFIGATTTPHRYT